MKIYVAGHKGLVGSAIVREIEAHREHKWIGKTRFELDLRDRESVFKFLDSEKPDAVIVAAAKVGGIMANSTFPVEFLSENLQIETNLIDGAHAAEIPNLLFLGSSCIYPRDTPQPIKEEYLLTGPLEPTNEPYALAKISGLKLVESYRKEYQRTWISAMPTNIFGPGDNFDLESSHVLPALLRKVHEAKSQFSETVSVWGSGEPVREFLYSDDLANACLHLLENYDSDSPINVGTGVDVKISELVRIIAEVVDYHGKIIFDASRPDGTPKKLLDVSKITNLGWKPRVDLRTGIQKTYDWFLEHEAQH
jgi:GDP-L-fucose synthase